MISQFCKYVNHKLLKRQYENNNKKSPYKCKKESITINKTSKMTNISGGTYIKHVQILCLMLRIEVQTFVESLCLYFKVA